MKINVQESLDTKQEVLALGLYDDNELFNKFNESLSKELEEAIKKKAFEREFGKTYSTTIKDSLYKSILVISLGKKQDLNIERIRRAMQRIVDYLRKRKYSSFTTNILNISDMTPKEIGRAATEGLMLSDYVFDKYKSKKDDRPELKAVFQYPDSKAKELLEGISQGKIIAEATNYAKDLVNEPAIVVTPEYIEAEAKKLSKHPKIKVKIMSKKELQQKGLNLLLAVSAGSDHDPRLIFIEYNNAPKGMNAIIGKGITFDSGGYDIKPAGQFADMKCDMSGAAAVLGTIKAVSELGIKQNILGVIPTCENLINGSAVKPGDIIQAYNGKTVEIMNTDAEGRLILADAVAYAEKNYKPETIIDLATLTGACVVALGYYASGFVCNDEKLSGSLVKAGNDSYDRVWQFPFYEEYQDNMDGDISDLKNMSVKGKGREAGAITGGVFISKFVNLDKTKWAHIDIAGPAFLPEAKEYNQKYASGCGVRLLSYYFIG